MSFIGGYQSDFGGGSGSNGGVFITDITPQQSGNVGSKVFSSDGRVLDHCIADTDLITVHVIAITGESSYKPIVTVEGLVVPLVEEEDRTLWTGTINLDRNGGTLITALHEDGPRHYCTVADDSGPVVNAAIFTGGYPGVQTELKEHDSMDLQITTDSPMVAVEVSDFGAGQPATINVAAGTNTTVSISIADRGITSQLLGCRIRCQNANGSWGPFFETGSAGGVDGVNLVQLNNQHPTISLGGVDYPSGQLALKNSEAATVNHSVAHFDTVIYDSPNGELAISNPFDVEGAKSVSRSAGGYNVNDPNFRITAVRAANGASSQVQTIIAIANLAPQISLETSGRLISGGNGFSDSDQTVPTLPQEHLVSLSSDQLLLNVPVITAPEGTLLGSMTGDLNGTAFSQTIQVHDNDAKGSYSFALSTAINLAGIPAVSITSGATYEIGGFVARVLPISAFGQESAIGTQVTDTSKLVALDKDLAAMNYVPGFSTGAKTYTITGPSGIQNPTGTILHWLDSQAIDNNTTGGATITISESA